MGEWSDDDLNWIYDRTDGCCHLCGRKVHFHNYGCSGRVGAWEVEHSVPRACGGTDHRNNLFPACIPCNRGKQAATTRSVRGGNGLSRAPRSSREKALVRRANTINWGVGGSLVGGLIGGLVGAAVGRPSAGVALGICLGTGVGAGLGSTEPVT